MDLKDASLKLTRALPASTSAVTSTALDTGKTTSLGAQPGEVEFLISAPAVSLAALPDTKTMTYALVQSSAADLSGATVLFDNLIIQTGATGTDPAVAATKRLRLPSDALRYIGLRITPSASGTGDASGVSATLEPLF